MLYTPSRVRVPTASLGIVRLMFRVHVLGLDIYVYHASFIFQCIANTQRFVSFSELSSQTIFPHRFVNEVNEAVANVRRRVGCFAQRDQHHSSGAERFVGVLVHELLHRPLARVQVGVHVLLGQTTPGILLDVGAVSRVNSHLTHPA